MFADNQNFSDYLNQPLLNKVHFNFHLGSLLRDLHPKPLNLTEIYLFNLKMMNE